MISGNEIVWIGNYVNQEEGLLYEVQMLTETKEEAHQKYVEYYRDEVMTWVGGKNYKLCSIDSLIEGRNVEELERDNELNWFFPDGFFADGDHSIEDLDEEEQLELIAKIISLPVEEKLPAEDVIIKKDYGFALVGGIIKQVLYYNGETYSLGLEEFSEEKLINHFKETIKNPEILDNNLKAIEDCKNMKWLNDEIYEKFIDEDNVSLKIAITLYSNKYHDQLKDDTSPIIRKIVAGFSDKYHNQFKDDLAWEVRKIVAGFSDKYHDQFKDDNSSAIREVVALYSDKYHEYLKDDCDRDVREAVKRYKKKKD